MHVGFRFGTSISASFSVLRPYFGLVKEAAVELQASPLVIIGPFGSGKTSTLKYAVSELDRRGALTTIADLSYATTSSQIKKRIRERILEAHPDRSRSSLLRRYGDEKGILLLDEATEVVSPRLLEEMAALGIRMILGMNDSVWWKNGPLASSLRGSLMVDITPTPKDMADLLYALGKDSDGKRRMTRQAATVLGRFAWQVSRDCCRLKDDLWGYEYPYRSRSFLEYIGRGAPEFQRLAIVLANEAWERAQEKGRDVVTVRDVYKLKDPDRLKFSTAPYKVV